MSTWKPSEIIVHQSVINDPVTLYLIQQCPDVPTKIVNDGQGNQYRGQFPDS